MNEKNLVICDREFRYANSLAENIAKREELAVKVFVCSSLEHVAELMRDKMIHLFVVDEKHVHEERKEIQATQTFVLCKGRVADLGDDECAVFKYQCADEIIREIFEYYIEKTKDNMMRSLHKDRARLVAVYSPIHRIGKTTFAIALGKEWAKKSRVLYVNAEEYAGFAEHSEDGLNLGDLLYYVKQGNGNLGIRLPSAVQRMEELDYIQPIPISADLKEVSQAEWMSLLDEILEESNYELVILDVGESIQGLFQILEKCDRIYMPVAEDEISNRKLQRFEKNLEQLNLERFPRITQRFVMPEHVEEYVKIRMKEEY